MDKVTAQEEVPGDRLSLGSGRMLLTRRFDAEPWTGVALEEVCFDINSRCFRFDRSFALADIGFSRHVGMSLAT